MSLISLAISVLWLLIGVIIILGVIWLALYVVRLFVAIPTTIEKAIWAIVLILVLIAALTVLGGGGGGISHFRLGLSGPALATTGLHWLRLT